MQSWIENPSRANWLKDALLSWLVLVNSLGQGNEGIASTEVGWFGACFIPARDSLPSSITRTQFLLAGIREFHCKFCLANLGRKGYCPV